MPDDRGSQPSEPETTSAAGATQLAQATDAPLQIGIAETVNGDVTVVHPDGTIEGLTTGAPILAGDRLQTGGDGDIAVIFEDESVMALGPDSDLVIDEMVYDPVGPDGSMLMTVSEGVFSFVSGAIAKVDPDALSIQTPSVVIGIRGTSLAARVRPEGEPSSYTLVDDPDGTVGEAVLQNAGGVQVINQIGQTVEPVSFFDAPPPPRLMAPEELATTYGSAIDALPAAFRPPVAGPPPPPRGQNQDGGNQGQDQAPPDEQQAAADQGGGDGDAAAADEAPPEEEIAEEELTPEEIAALEAEAEAEQTAEDGLVADDDASGDEEVADEGTAFGDALSEADPFGGNEKAAAAAEAAFNEALATGASLDEATLAALAAGSEVVAETAAEPTVETESVEEIGVINDMTSTVDYNAGNIFSAPVAGSNFGTARVSGAAVAPPTSQDQTSAGTDGGDDGGDGFGDEGDDGGDGEISALMPPAPPPPAEPVAETEPDPSPEPAPAAAPTGAAVIGTVPGASSAELFTLEAVNWGTAFRLSDVEDTPPQLSVSIATQPTSGSVTVLDVGSQASVASRAAVASRASSASQAFVASMASAASVGSVATITTRAAVASIASVASQASVASHASIASRASQGSQAEAGLQFFVPSQASFASYASVASQAFVASAASRASAASVGSLASAAAVASVASVASQASHASVASFAAADGQSSQASFAGETVYDYIPDVGTTGSDTFVYTVTDSDGNTTQASINVTIQPMATQTGTETNVNTVNTSGTQSFASIAADHFGQHVVVFLDGNSGDILAQRFDSAGAKLGTEFAVNTTGTGNQSVSANANAVTYLDNGDFVVVWESDHGGANDVYMQLFTNAGEPLGSETIVNVTTANSQSHASVAGLKNGGFAVAWTGGNTTYDTFVRIFSPDGQGGSELQVNTGVSASSSASSPQLAALENGGFVVTWSSGDTTNDEVYAEIYDNQGNVVTAEFQVNTTTTNVQDEISVAALNDGGFVVVWASDASGDFDIYGQRYDSTGTAQGTEFLVNTTTANSQDIPEVTRLEDGGWLVTWTADSGQDGTGKGIFVQRYNSDGTTNGSEFQINTLATGDESDSALATVPDGGFIAAWHSTDGDGTTDTGVLSKVFFIGATSTLSENGTAGNDAYIGSILADVIDSLGGNDEIFGMAGNDMLTGGDGNDLIQGGPGDDTIDGGAGNDLLYGESGTDTITGGTGSDRFYFDAQTGNTTVLDFTPGTDKLVIDHSLFGDNDIVFEQLTGVTYDGTNAINPSANIIVDDQGDVYHDNNGNASGGYTLIGTVEDGASGVPTMSATDVEKS